MIWTFSKLTFLSVLDSVGPGICYFATLSATSGEILRCTTMMCNFKDAVMGGKLRKGKAYISVVENRFETIHSVILM